MAGKASRENGKKGGRPKGRRSASTLEREAVLRAFNQRVMRQADRLFHAQMMAAEGVSFLFRRPKRGGASVRVTDQETLRQFFDGELDDDPSTLFYVVTERPSAEAADRLLNRALGKAKESVEVSGPGGGPVHIRNFYAIPKPDADV
jgi:hypothetical protein